MKRSLTMFVALLLLTACETNQQDKEAIKAQAKQDIHVVEGKATASAMRVANTIRDNVKTTSMKMREWWLTPLPDQTPLPVPPAYCYRVMQDITCYRAPMPGMEHQLVGYQGENPPPVAQMKALPVSRIQKQTANATGATRVANAKPVFVAIPTPVKEDTSTQMTEGTVPIGSEPLPDPSLSPQL